MSSLLTPTRTEEERSTNTSLLADCVRRALRSTGYRELQDLLVVIEEEAVHLEGLVDSYFLKQVAQVAVQRVSPLCEIHNRLTVRR